MFMFIFICHSLAHSCHVASGFLSFLPSFLPSLISVQFDAPQFVSCHVMSCDVMPFICLFVHSFVRSFVHPFIHSIVNSVIQLIHSIMLSQNVWMLRHGLVDPHLIICRLALEACWWQLLNGSQLVVRCNAQCRSTRIRRAGPDWAVSSPNNPWEWHMKIHWGGWKVNVPGSSCLGAWTSLNSGLRSPARTPRQDGPGR